MTPCFNAAADLEVLYRDLERLDLSIPGGRVHIRHIVVDNASATPLRHVPVPEGWKSEVIRLRTNTGGSCGYNAGMAHALQTADEPPEFLWLLDKFGTSQLCVCSVYFHRLVCISWERNDPNARRERESVCKSIPRK